MQLDEQQKGRRASRLILLSVCIGQTIVGLDQRAITVALPTLTTTFHTAFTTIQWTVLIYDLVLVGLIITMGRLGDLYGRRRFYSLGFLIFVTASAVCGLTQTTGQLIFCRAIQALGGSMIAANGRAIVSVNLPPHERGRALGRRCRDDRHHRANRRSYGGCAIGDLVRLPVVSCRIEQQPDRIVGKLARRARNLYRLFFEYDPGPQHLHATRRLFLRRQRTKTRRLIC